MASTAVAAAAGVNRHDGAQIPTGSQPSPRRITTTSRSRLVVAKIHIYTHSNILVQCKFHVNGEYLKQRSHRERISHNLLKYFNKKTEPSYYIALIINNAIS